VLAELLARPDLTAKLIDAIGRDVSGLCMPFHDPHHAVVGAMPRLWPIGAGTARLVAPQVLSGQRPAAHRLRLGELASEVTDGGRHVGAFGHGVSSFALS
jgi:hypothetical protein